MTDAKLVNIVKLMTTYNLEIEELPEYLKCAQCKLVLKDACQVPCGCTYCRTCIDDMMARGSEFCLGVLEDCGESPLSRFSTDYVINKRVSRLTVACPNNECKHKCELVNIEEHMRMCLRKNEECPFHALGCKEDQLIAEDIGFHLQQESRSHSEILIGMIANINREIGVLKQKGEANRSEIETLKQNAENSTKEIEKLKQRDEANSWEIEMLKSELMLKDGQIKSTMNQLIHVQNENKSIKNDIKSIKGEKEDLAGRVRILSEQIEREITERRENDELDSARVINHVDREIATVTGLIGSNKCDLATEMQSVSGDIGSINNKIISIKEDICFLKLDVQSIQLLVGLVPVDARCDWLITTDIVKTSLYGFDKESDYFFGVLHPYKYRLRLENLTGLSDPTLYIQLYIYTGPSDGRLPWPFKARVIITVADKDRREVCRCISQQCRIEKPSENGFKNSDLFMFNHSELKGAGMNLSRGVRVTCLIDFPISL